MLLSVPLQFMLSISPAHYVVVPDTPDGAEKALEAETYHIKPTSQVQKGADGTLFRTYKMLRGSSNLRPGSYVSYIFLS